MTAVNSGTIEANPLLPGTGRNESLRRAFDLLELLARHPHGASVAELCQDSDLPRSTVSRLLASLFDAGAVSRPGNDRKWVLGPTIMRLTNAVAPLAGLQERSREVLEQITTDIGETSMVAVPTGPATARVIDEVRGPKLVGVLDPWAGETISSAASGFVRMLLAELPEAELDRIISRMELVRHTPKTITDPLLLARAIEDIRRQGHVVVVDELEDGLAGLGYPVRKGGQLVAMLAVYLPTIRFTPELQSKALAVLERGARELGD
ncbi:IclR family transcriptional regulator [Sinomonas sp. JGH33]|uniref:IclR family transcriptional regulator n=1 Tax=Sinomonas terricola TaxID=3110330 RepID=A0ABU5TCJ3_9MICC|nr:IclR family transcriptional regulator [Sinomonas sp. JGH33]MEA5456786.1 IclR family transcriptional regulator [Sinomonas sp. JGH33]